MKPAKTGLGKVQARFHVKTTDLELQVMHAICNLKTGIERFLIFETLAKYKQKERDVSM